jgi:hypothetical protein
VRAAGGRGGGEEEEGVRRGDAQGATRHRLQLPLAPARRAPRAAHAAARISPAQVFFDVEIGGVPAGAPHPRTLRCARDATRNNRADATNAITQAAS